MSLFKRLSVTVKAHLDDAVSRIENHDAVIEAALGESRDAIARMKVQQSRMHKELQRLDDRIAQLHREEQDWVRRAKSVAASDEVQALECLTRRDRCSEQARELRRQRDQGGATAARLADRLGELERKLADDERRLRECRGRDLAARAEQSLRMEPGAEPANLEQAFDRWELDLVRQELGHPDPLGEPDGTDPLEQRFRREERLAAQRAELKALMEDAS